MYCTVVEIYGTVFLKSTAGAPLRALCCQLGHARMRAVLAHRGARPRDIRMLPM